MTDDGTHNLPQKIESLHQEFSSYKKESFQKSQKHHADRVQVLFAIAVLGWFFTNYKGWINSLFDPQLLKFVFAFASIVSLSFLILKMLVTVFNPALSIPLLESPEKALRYLYVILVSIIVAIAPVIVISNVLKGIFPNVGIKSLSLINLVIAAIISGIIVKRYTEKRKKALEQIYIDIQTVQTSPESELLEVDLHGLENISLDPKELQISIQSGAGIEADFLATPTGFAYNARHHRLENIDSINMGTLTIPIGVELDDIHTGFSRNVTIVLSVGEERRAEEVEINFEE